jgi:ABC-type uncharacterized transport system ATPase subunit
MHATVSVRMQPRPLFYDRDAVQYLSLSSMCMQDGRDHLAPLQEKLSQAMQTLTQGLPGRTIAFAGPNGIGKTFNINLLMLATEQDAHTYQRVNGAKEDMQLLTTMEGVMQLW